jgi:Raf kinase inhibitor-like YbhB/YbcL family protein
MKLWSNDFKDGATIPASCAFGKPNPQTHVELSDNKNPHLAWSELPVGTRSLVLICHDPDVPSRPDNVNKEGVTVPASLPRVDFYHWVLVDLTPGTGSIGHGELSAGITPKGKTGPAGPHGTSQGLNNYTEWFAADADMGGKYFGYDGPCPPWNDEIIHHYHFTLYATDLEKCPLEGEFTGPDVLKAIDGHILGSTKLTGTYAIYPNAR